MSRRSRGRFSFDRSSESRLSLASSSSPPTMISRLSMEPTSALVEPSTPTAWLHWSHHLTLKAYHTSPFRAVDRACRQGTNTALTISFSSCTETGRMPRTVLLKRHIVRSQCSTRSSCFAHFSNPSLVILPRKSSCLTAAFTSRARRSSCAEPEERLRKKRLLAGVFIAGSDDDSICSDCGIVEWLSTSSTSSRVTRESPLPSNNRNARPMWPSS
mmetsp:Transcript_3636/g.14282  ORF Transcript_3636/g.14282 Transcript_3636/m.14282 type:complete len:215 (+) Transcript_3636:204-848(+)